MHRLSYIERNSFKNDDVFLQHKKVSVPNMHPCGNLFVEKFKNKLLHNGVIWTSSGGQGGGRKFL